MKKNKLKKLIAFTMALTLSASVFMGCKNNDSESTSDESLWTQ